MALLFNSNCFIFYILLFFTNQCIWRPKSIFFFLFYDLRMPEALVQIKRECPTRSPELSGNLWQCGVFSLQVHFLPGVCSRGMSVIDPFWYQWCAGLCVACGEGFRRSVPHHSLLELVKPRRRDLLGIIKPTSGKWKSDWPKQSCKCFML